MGYTAKPSLFLMKGQGELTHKELLKLINQDFRKNEIKFVRAVVAYGMG